MYFDSKVIQPKVEEYCRLYVEDREQANKLFTELYPDIRNVVRGVINIHGFTKYDSYDELESVGMIAIYSSLHRFNPNYVASGKQENLLFSYLSLVAKRAIQFETMRAQKHRNNFSMVDQDGDTMDFEDTRSYEEYETMIDHIREKLSPQFGDNPIFEYFLAYLKEFRTFSKKQFYTQLIKDYECGNFYIAFNNGKKRKICSIKSLSRTLFREIRKLGSQQSL